MSSELSTWFCGIALLASAACGGAQSKASKVELPAEVGELPARLEGDYHVFAVNCSKCHGLERAFSAPVSDHGHWERYVNRMMRTPGSGISAREAPNILAFLFWYTDKKTGKSSGKDQPLPAPAVSAPEVPQDAPAAEPAPVVEPQPQPQGEGAP